MLPIILFTGWKQQSKDNVITWPFKLLFVYPGKDLSVTWDPPASLGAEITVMGYTTHSAFTYLYFLNGFYLQ